MATIIIDADNAILGRLAAYAAKRALMGDTVRVVNAEHAVVSGTPNTTVEEAKREHRMGVPRKGPFHFRMPDRHVRRVIRGMLPHKFPRGRTAFARVRCYIGTPVDLQGQKTVRAPGADASKLPNMKRVTVGRICEELGGKHYD